MNIQLPTWLETVEEDRQATEKTRFYLKIAALYVSPDGRLSDLSKACGLQENTLATVSQRGPLSPEIAIVIEKTVGRDIIPRHLLRPDLFEIPG